MDTKTKDLLTSSMEKIHEMADANTIMGKPVEVSGGVTVIPISKVSYGFAGGGSDLPTKSEKELFGGGSGAGITITPIAFLVISNGEVQLMQMNLDVSATSAIVNMVPDVVSKVTNLIKDKGKGKGKDKSAKLSDEDTADIELPPEMIEKDSDEDFSD